PDGAVEPARAAGSPLAPAAGRAARHLVHRGRLLRNLLAFQKPRGARADAGLELPGLAGAVRAVRRAVALSRQPARAVARDRRRATRTLGRLSAAPKEKPGARPGSSW